MTRCEAVGVELLHRVPDGSVWSTVQTNNTEVVTLLPLPLPAPPPGGTFEVYGAISAGQAALISALTCPGDPPEQTWSVTVDVSG